MPPDRLQLERGGLEAITITLDGVEVSGYSGMSLLTLAREAGVDIPTLCNDLHLAPFGACRLCVVEDEKSGALLASCVTPLRPGLVINTRSPRVIERRKIIIELMLASHPDSCLVCDKGNQCQLRKLAADMGVGLVRLQRIPQAGTIQEVNPFIERDLSKCIMCARCIRADQELVVEGAIDYMNRGFIAKPATLGDVALENSECTFCGTCVATCPTGALREKSTAYRGATMTSVDTVCPYCGCGCGISLDIKDDRIVRVKPSETGPVNHGSLCSRGCYGYDFIHSPDRLTVPLIKNNGSFEPASWEQALERAAGEFKRIKDKYGPGSLAVLGSPRCTNEENYLLQKFARAVFGTNNIDNGSRLYSPASRIGLGCSVGFPGTTSSLDELEKSDVIMVIGANPAVSAPVVGYAVKRAVKYKGAKLLLIDVRQTKLAPFARLWLQPKVGTDIALVNGISRIIVKEGIFDEEFVTRRTDRFAEFEKGLDIYTPEYVEKITSVPARDIQLAARLLAGASHASIIYGNGITQHLNGADGVMAVVNLAMLTGNTGYRRGGIFALQRENNARGACEMGSLPDFLPGYQSIEDGRAREIFEEHWKVSLPAGTGLTALEMLEQARAGKLKAMFIMGENPLASFPDPSWVKQALTSLESLVVTDMFLTETAKLATVVLPAASFAEKEGTFTSFEGKIQQLRKAIRPAGSSLPDWEVISKIAKNLNYPMKYTSARQIMEEISELVPSYQRLSDSRLETGDSDWGDMENEERTRQLSRSPFLRGFGRFSTVKYTPREANDGYPLTLLAGSVLHHFGSGTRSLRASRLSRFASRGWLEISPVDAKSSGIRDGDAVKIVSSAGEVTTTARVTDTLSQGTVFMPISFPSSPVNELFGTALDSRTKAPELKACPVRLERIANNG